MTETSSKKTATITAVKSIFGCDLYICNKYPVSKICCKIFFYNSVQS